MRLSIIIITYNGLRYLEPCLRSLATFVGDPECQVIVVDNASTDGTLPFLRQHYSHLTIIENDTNRGVAAARNQGMAVATGDKILLLDNDTIATDDAIRAMSQYLDEHPRVGLCACRLTDKDGVPQDSCKPFPGLLIKARNVLGIGNRSPYTPDPDGIIRPVYVIGACQMFRRQLIDRIGYLDEHIFYGPEDADWCLRIAAAGQEIHCLTSHTIIHDYRRATKRRPFSRLARLHVKALLYFYRKHRRIA